MLTLERDMSFEEPVRFEQSARFAQNVKSAIGLKEFIFPSAIAEREATLAQARKAGRRAGDSAQEKATGTIQRLGGDFGG
jgi:hypothetical protein